MNKKIRLQMGFRALLVMALLAMLALSTGAQPGTGSPVSNSAPHRSASAVEVLETYGQLPLSFEPNQGQFDAQVKFISRGAGYSLFLTPTEAVLVLRKPAVQEREDPTALESALAQAEEKQAVEQTVLRMQLVGANAAPQMVGLEELPGKVNYFLGNDPAKWRANVPTYAKVKYQDVYLGVDLVYYGNQGQLEYDFVIAPGADPAVIRLDFAGAEKLELDAEGELVMNIAGEQVRMRKPVIYQERDGKREEISGGYALLSHEAEEGEGLHQVGFRLGRYDTGRPLVIDPVLVYSTYLGGSGGEFVRGFAVDPSGNVYIAGGTFSTNFPTANAVQPAFGGGFTDEFVTKLNPTGGFIYSTYLGGSGSESNFSGGGLNSVAVDPSGNAYVVGSTNSTDFPIANAVQSTFGGGFTDAFVTKLSATGGLDYSTYLGGSGSDTIWRLNADASGNAYVAGNTTSSNFPTTNAVQPIFGGSNEDFFVTKFNATGGDVYSTYLGGNDRELFFPDLTVDASGNAYVTGVTRSHNFPTWNAVQSNHGGGLEDVFVTKLNATGEFVYSTFLGGSAIDVANHFAVDTSGNTFVAGHTTSANFPTVNAVQSTFLGGGIDAFVTKLNAAGGFVYSTYLGGSGFDLDRDFAVDISGNAYLVGDTDSTNYPTANAVQATFGGGRDIVMTKLNATGGLVYSTYLGGSGSDQLPDLAVDASSNAYVVGDTDSTNFPTANAVQPTFGGSLDAFATKLNATGALVYSTYLGGSDVDIIRNVAVDTSGNAYGRGTTVSTNFPTANALQPNHGGGTCGFEPFTFPCSDVIVTKLNATGGFVYSTYLGGSGNDFPSHLAVDASGNAYVVGSTSSPDFPTANAVQSTLGGFSNLFVTKIGDNQPPTTYADGPYNVGEGGSVTVTATGNDPEGGSLTYAWDLDNDGTFETLGQTATFSAASLDGSSSYTIAVQVTDNGGLTATDQATVNVLNVAPTASFASTPDTLLQGQSATLVFSNPFDPGTADTTAGFLYSYDCTNDGTFELSDSSAASYICAYPTSSVFAARGRIADQDGGYTDYTVQVTVLTPRQGIEGLIVQVQALVPGTLNGGQGNALIAKLEAAIRQLDRGNVATAINQLESFVNQVSALISGGVLPAAEGQPLIDAANGIIAALSG